MRDTAVTSRASETDSRSSPVPSFDSYAEGRSFHNANQSRIVVDRSRSLALTAGSALASPRQSGTSSRRSRSWSLLVPPEHTHGPEGVPPAWYAFALVHRKVRPAGMGILEGPAAIRIALGLDQVDRLGHPLIRNGAGRAQVVEAPEHIVVPVRRVGKLREGWVDELAGRLPAQHLSFE